MNYQNISKCDVSNGINVGVVLWVSGCIHHCKNCHNPQTWSVDSGITFDNKAKQELFEALAKPYISRITFSGGDPLHSLNRDTIKALSEQIHNKFPNIKQWLYTGYTFEQICNNGHCYEYLPHIDVLIDGKYEEDKRDITLAWRGSSNQRVIDVQKSLQQQEVVLWCE